MRYPLTSIDNELLAVSKLRLRAAVGRLTGHKTLRAHLYKTGHTEEQECRLCVHDKEDSVHIVCHCPVHIVCHCPVHIVCHCPVLPCKKYRTGSVCSLSLKILRK